MQSEMVSRWRPDGTIIYCNEAFARQCGRALNEVVGANLFDLTPPHEMAQIQRNVAAPVAGAGPTSGYDHHIPGDPAANAGRNGSTGPSSTRRAGTATSRSGVTSPPASWPSGSWPRANGA